MTPLDVLVVRHTHWDREWYHPAARFRQRLVALVDELLDDAPEGARGDDPAAGSFLLDGQTIVLDDYLAVRPERRDALAAALREGRLEAGPWYVLADELIPGGEALLRNLLAGRRALAALGAEAPPVLYSPDAFGHAAALPAIAAGFGYRLVVAWRGYGGARWPAGDAAWWRAPGGETALLFHLPRDGYEYGSSLPADADGAAERWGRMRAELVPRARLGLALVQNGADHHARQPRWAEAHRALVAAAAPDRVRLAALRDFASLALARAGESLPGVAGELRDSYGYTWTLQGTLATRAHQKRRNAHAERLLGRDVEPWLALLRLRDPADDAAADRRLALLGAAWRTLLRCHPHDTLCGCSVDGVARAMDARLDSALAQGDGLRGDALDALAGHDPVAARERRALWRSVAVVRNRAPRPRGGVAEVELLTFVRDVPVGPGSAGAWRPVTAPGASPVVTMPRGEGASSPLPLQVLERALRHDRIESPRHYPDDDLVESARALVYVRPVPAYGTTSLLLDPTPRGDGAGGGDTIAHPVAVADNALDNGIVRVAVDERGRVRVAAPSLGVAVDDVLAFEDVGDAGDTYTHSPLGAPLRSAWCTGVHTVHRGPLRGEIEARYRFRVPAAAEPAEDGFSRPARRARRHVELPLTLRVSLDADATFVRVRVEGENIARDHRLRVLLSTGVADATVVADAALGPVERRAIDVSPEERAVEAPPPTAPLHRWVALHGDAHGAVVVSDGLAEYEARDDGAVAVTLVRAVGELSRPDLPERPGHAGWPTLTPEAQCEGPFAAELALAFVGPRGPAVEAEVERLAEDVLLPLVGTTTRSALEVPPPVRGFELVGDGLAFGAAKPAEDGRRVALRCVNVTGEQVTGAWRVSAAVARAWLARLDETPLAALAVEHDGETAVVRFAAPPRATVTVLVEPPRAG